VTNQIGKRGWVELALNLRHRYSLMTTASILCYIFAPRVVGYLFVGKKMRTL
jgi:hypothetical protein